MVKVDKGVFGPNLLAQFFARDQFARTFQEDGTDLKGLALQGDLRPILAEFASAQVRLKDSEANNMS